MFNLESELKKWRKNMRRNPHLTEGDVAEQESHIRDEIRKLIDQGLDEKASFEMAAGDPDFEDALAGEYQKIRQRAHGRPFRHPSRFLPALGWNYFKVAARRFRRQKRYSIINIAGLSTGILCSLSLVIAIQYELSYDRHYANARDIYRVITQWPQEFMNSNKITWTSALMAPALKAQFSEVAGASRVAEKSEGISLAYGDRAFFEKMFYFVDPDFLSVFSIRLLQGQKETALNNPLSVVISEEMAGKYFPAEDPLGKILRYNNTHDFLVSGVFRNVPTNTHFRYDFLASFPSLFVLEGENAVYVNQWTSLNYQTYIQLRTGADPSAFEKIMGTYLLKNTPESMKDYRYFLQPLTKIHLGGNLPGDLSQNGQMKYVYIYSGIALLIILITCFNYINLSTARFSARAAEIQIRKVVGAQRRQLIQQFVGETLLTTVIAFIIAFLVILFASSYLNKMTGADFNLSLLKEFPVWIGAISLVCLICMISAYYPALYMTSLRLPRFMKSGTIEGLAQRRTSGKIFVVAQFAISTALVVSTLTIHRQVGYIMNINFGQLKGTVVTLRVSHDNENMKKGIDVFKQELLKDPAVERVAVSSWLPTNIRSGNNAVWAGMKETKGILFHNLKADRDFFDLFSLSIVQGRNFSNDFASDSTQAYIVNETAVRAMGLKDPVGRRFAVGNDIGVIIGVVKDFHFVPVHQRIKPLAIRSNPKDQLYLSIKIHPRTIDHTIQVIEEKWKKISPGFAFSYAFLDDDVAALYRSETRLGISVSFFTGMALFLAHLGLFGLTMFSVERRVKEIGIRKVCGAGISPIIILISKDFFMWILAANFISLPAAYIVLTRWLQGFAYRTQMDIGIFVLSFVLSFALAVLTVGSRVYKAASANPVDSLRYE